MVIATIEAVRSTDSDSKVHLIGSKSGLRRVHNCVGEEALRFEIVVSS